MAFPEESSAMSGSATVELGAETRVGLDQDCGASEPAADSMPRSPAHTATPDWPRIATRGRSVGDRRSPSVNASQCPRPLVYEAAATVQHVAFVRDAHTAMMSPVDWSR